MHSRSATILFLLLLCKLCPAQSPGYETISTAQGLSQGMVFDLLQDREGFIWVATKNGLNRYDGYNFQVFSNDPYNPATLSSNTVLKIFEDSKGLIWAGTENAGLNVYDKKTAKFYRIGHAVSNPASLSGNAIRFIHEMPDGRMLVAVDGAGVNVVQLPPGFFDRGIAPIVTRLRLPKNTQVYGMGTDSKGTVWIGGMDGAVYRFDPLNYSFTKVDGGQLLNSGYLTPGGNILINSNLFLSNGKSIYPLFDTHKILPGNIIFRPREKLWENLHRETHFYDASKWMPGSTAKWNVHLADSTRLVYPFLIDRSGVLWSGSVGYGLRKYNSTATGFKPLMPRYSVRWIVPVATNDILLGDFGYGWQRLKNNAVEQDPFGKISSVTQIDNLLVTRSGDYWIKSDNRGYFHYRPSSARLTHHPEINDYQSIGDKQPMLEDSKGFIWFPGRGGMFTRLHPPSGTRDSFTINTNTARPLSPKATCTALFEDEEGTFWIGTQDGFAKVVMPSSDGGAPRVTWFYNSNSSRNSLNYNHVSCFMDHPSEPDKYLWVGTKGGGLNRLEKGTGNFYHLTTKEGLPHDVIYGLLSDDAGNIWGSTNNGIFCLMAKTTGDGSKPVFRNFSRANGLQDDEFNTGAYAKLSNGQLAFGGVNGLNIFDPAEILSASFTPNVYLTNIQINNKPVLPGDASGLLQTTIETAGEITLNHQQDILTLEFSSLDFTSPAQNKYRYQLVGIDEDWVESGSRRTATYLHLPPGQYTFKVQGSNSQGTWSSKVAALKITVLPPWWLSWWAYSIYAILLLLAIRTYFKFSVNRAKLRAQLSFEQLEAKRMKELDTLKTQLYTNITHEFRTPLTVILGMAHQAMNKPGDHVGKAMDMIIRNGQSLLKLVNEMLDLAKLEAGNMSLQTVNGDVINFLRYVVESFHSLAEEAKIGLHFLTDIHSLPVAYDAERLRQIVANLLSNALKFTPGGGHVYISISKNVLPHDEPNLTLIIKVKDTGAGIPEDKVQHIFNRFYQLDNSHTRKAEGTGIGLALTKELVKLMEGEIIVKSPPTGANRGSEFTVILPLTMTAATEHAAAYPGTNGQQRPPKPVLIKDWLVTADNENKIKPLILLVEDNADVVAYTASCLADYRLVVGKDGQEGFDLATERVPDLIITDVMMPFMDGFELCRRLRNDERSSHIPIVILTAKADVESRLEGLQQGADAYVEKPFHREELLMRIKKLLELRRNLQQYYLKKSGLNKDQLMDGFTQEAMAAEDKAEDVFVKKVRETIEKNLTDTGFTVEQLCKLVYMSHSQVHRKLEALTGCSPNQFIRLIRISKAKELLKNPANSIGSVALDCGYNDPGYFGRVFKQECGVTPQEWRTRNKLVV